MAKINLEKATKIKNNQKTTNNKTGKQDFFDNTETSPIISQNPQKIEYDQKMQEYIEIVKKDGSCLKDIPKSEQTYEICLEAVKNCGYAIKYTSKRIISPEFCSEAVKCNGMSLCYVPQKYFSHDLYLTAIQQNGLALEYVPIEERDITICLKAVQNNGLAIKDVPKEYLTKEIYDLALQQNWLAIQYLPKDYATKSTYIEAVSHQPLALQYVPNRIKSHELCKTAVKSDWRAFAYVKRNMYTEENIIAVYTRVLAQNLDRENITYKDEYENYLSIILDNIPDEFHKNNEIIHLERLLYLREITGKRYVSITKDFQVIERMASAKNVWNTRSETRSFLSFVEFYQYVDHNLKGADLYDYDFEGINLNEFDIDGAYIKSEVLIKNNLYDATYYDENIKPFSNTVLDEMPQKSKITAIQPIVHKEDSGDIIDSSECNIYYICDIHLNQKLCKKFPKFATKTEIEKYVEQLVVEMIKSRNNSRDYYSFPIWEDTPDYLLIGGDVADNFEISAVFYRILVKYWYPNKIIAILGNHELWDQNDFEPKTNNNKLDYIINKYRAFFDELGIRFLQNSIYASNLTDSKVISEKTIQKTNISELQALLSTYHIIIFGGIGFSGLCDNFNASNGIYRDTISSLNDDILQSKKIENAYKKLSEIIADKTVVIFTHTPFRHWTSLNYNKNWIYVSGHTHLNEYISDKSRRVYSDNQIGYNNQSLGLKSFKVAKKYISLTKYKDGIYKITREEYISFYRSINSQPIKFNQSDGQIYMLKNQGVYCFLYVIDNSKYFILSGGQKLKLKICNINYYYNRLPQYSKNLKDLYTQYRNVLEKISSYVKKIGGWSDIHGCIIDIDFYNHIYVNPYDLTITPYYATSMVDKYVYPNMLSLLTAQRKDLLSRYHSLCITGDIENKPVEKVQDPIPVPETTIYGISRFMSAIQYLYDLNIIRIWSDEDLDSLVKLIDDKKSIIKSLAETTSE